MRKFKVGQKVTPINKTVVGFDSLSKSKHWNKAQNRNQPFLYIQHFDDSENAYVCNVDNGQGSGCYFNESDLIPYRKTTKNQRITALENEVKRLDKFSEGLRGELTGALKRIESLEAKLVEKVAVVEKSANEQRAEMIEKAKAFVKKYQAVRAGESSHSKGNHTCRQHYYETEFVVKGNKVTALVRWLTWGEEVQKEVQHVGRAYCSPTDVFNEWIGKAIALGRALGLDVSEFENAVQPNEIAVGQVIFEVDYRDVHTVTRVENDSIYFGEGFYYKWRFDEGEIKIINDTNAIYGGAN